MHFWHKKSRLDLCKELKAGNSEKEKFISLNEKLWKAEDKGKKEYCYIINWTPDYLASILPQLVFAKGLAKQSNLEILVLSPGVDEDWVRFCGSFGAKQVIVKRGLPDKLDGFMKALQLVIGRATGEEILRLRYKKIPLGECVYDNMIRTTKACTVEKIGWVNFPKLYEIFADLSCMYRIFCKKSPNYYIPFERCHKEGAFAIMAAYLGAHVVQCTSNGRIIYLGKEQSVLVRAQDLERIAIEEYMNKEYPDEYLDKVKEYLRERFSGKGEQEVVNAFANKEIVSRKEFVEKNKLDPGKKNVVIMSHVFSDEPHSSAFLLFRDYYTWYEETLKMASKIKNVNWIVKAHPSRRKYGEEEEAYNVFLKYKSSHIVWCAEEYSTESLVDVADIILTVQGSAGTEFSCFGKPIVLAGKSFYSGYGFTIDPKTVDEYREVLEGLHQLPPLETDRIHMACKLLYCRLLMGFKPYDAFDRLLVESYGLSGFEGNTMVLKNLTGEMEKDKDYFRNTKFYRVGMGIREKIGSLQVGQRL